MFCQAPSVPKRPNARCLSLGGMGAGFLRDEPKIWTANAVGFFVGCFYFLEFVRYAPKRSRSLPGSVTQHFQACFLVILGTLTLGCLDPSAIIIGHLAVLFCVVMFASPLAALPTVLETQSAQAIPLAYTAAVLTNSILWTIVGLLDMHDVHIYFPTVLGLGLSGIQLYLKLKFGNGNDINGIGATIVGGSTGFDDTALLFSPVL